MGLCPVNGCLILVIILSISSRISASTFLSDGIFRSEVSTGRNLLQAKKACSVNFEFQNYTIITSRCKGPQYPPKECCGALKEFACPFAEELNDLTNECASTMFSYINLYGKYPPGLFSSECKEGKEGLACDDVPPAQAKNVNSTSSGVTRKPYPALIFATACLGIGLFI